MANSMKALISWKGKSNSIVFLTQFRQLDLNATCFDGFYVITFCYVFKQNNVCKNMENDKQKLSKKVCNV